MDKQKNNLEKLNEDELMMVSGGFEMAKPLGSGKINPMVGLSYKNIMKEIKEIKDRDGLGSAKRRLKAWRSGNLKSEEYLDNKEEVDDLVDSE